MAGLAVQNFASAAVGVAVAIALVRGFARSQTDRLGNFWVDLTRICLRVLLPIALVFAIVFVGAGMIQNFHDYHDDHTPSPAATRPCPAARSHQEVIKELGTNGGGFFNANSAHPFENPTTWTNWMEIFLLLCISFSLPRTFGVMVGDRRQGRAIVTVMAILAVTSVILLTVFQADTMARFPPRSVRVRKALRRDSGCRTRRHSLTAQRSRRPARWTASTTATPAWAAR